MASKAKRRASFTVSTWIADYLRIAWGRKPPPHDLCSVDEALTESFLSFPFPFTALDDIVVGLTDGGTNAFCSTRAESRRRSNNVQPSSSSRLIASLPAN